MELEKIKNREIEQLKIIIQNIYKHLLEEYMFDLYLPNYKKAEGVNLSKREYFIENTFKIYKNYHKDFKEYIVVCEDIKEIFLNLIKKDTTIQFDNTIIYKELYKILFHINYTLYIINILNDPKQYPDKFAKIQSDLKKVNQFRKHYKDNLIGLRKIMGKNQSRFRYWFTTLYIKNKKLTKMFTYFFLLADIEKIKLFQDDLEFKDIFLNELDFFLFQNTAISKVVKSLGILLYYEMIIFLKISRKKAEEYSSHLIYYLFNENLNTYEFNKIIQFSSSVGYYPIFAASKKDKFTENEESFIYKKLYNEIQIYGNIDDESFKTLFDFFIKNPHIQFLHKYPQELFRKNSKYSSIIL